MAEANASRAATNKRYAIVTGANKGIGLEICRQLASNGVGVVLTARDEKKGLEALEKLQKSGLSDNVAFHQLDVKEPSSIASFADFIRSHFGRLDILVNNAGISGLKGDPDVLGGRWLEAVQGKLNGIVTENYELAVECIQTNYYGAKIMAETFIPLLQLSDSPRIVNVSATLGKLKYVSNEWAKGILSDADNLTEEKVDEVLNEFLKNFKEGGSIQAKGWAPILPAYALSKAAMNAYTRILAKKYPTFCVNAVCPGLVKTDINFNNGDLSVEEGAKGPVVLALQPNGGPSGLFFDREGVSSFE